MQKSSDITLTLALRNMQTTAQSKLIFELDQHYVNVEC